MGKGDLDIDPSGVIAEAYRIDGITTADCRTIFFDWAVARPIGTDAAGELRELNDFYGTRHPDHPMTAVLREGLATGAAPARRGGRKARFKPRG